MLPSFFLCAEAYNILGGNIHKANTDKNSGTRQQTLDGSEQDSWKTVDQLEANMRALHVKVEQRPSDYGIHLKFLAYAMFLLLKDVMVFRLDLLYNTVVCLPDEMDQHDICLVLDQAAQSVYLVFNNYKTSATYGRVRVNIPGDLNVILAGSFNMFPRSYLFTKLSDRDSLMQQSTASSFLRSAWVLDGVSPTAQNIRSALATRFFRIRGDVISRDAFAERSMVNRGTMELNYVKMSPSGVYMT